MKRVDSMNVIPLIDVMLVLLAIVLLTASFIVHDKLDIQLPKTEHTESMQQDNEKHQFLALDHEGKIYWDSQLIEKEQFKKKLAALNKEASLQLKVDQTVEFRHFVDMIDQIKHQQLDNLTILTERR